jgi:tetratricopeptide (TPR) repeat protein
MNKLKSTMMIPLIALAVWLATLAIWPSLKYAWYDIQTLEARKQVQSWLSEPEKPLNLAQWIDVRDRLEKASQACPNIAQYHIDLARLQVLRGLKAANFKLVRDVFYQEAINQYRAALQVQPNNGSTMANMVQFKAYLKQNDAEFEQLLIRSAQLNPYEPDSQLALLNAWFQNWDQLSLPMRKQIAQIYKQAKQQQKDNVLKLKANYPMLNV